jgi:hypothetical protein
MMQTTSTSETAVKFYQIRGAGTQKTATFVMLKN